MLYNCLIQKQTMYDNETFQSQSFTNYKSKYSVGAAQHFQEQFFKFYFKKNISRHILHHTSYTL